jgi:hypothetical protein
MVVLIRRSSDRLKIVGARHVPGAVSGAATAFLNKDRANF